MRHSGFDSIGHCVLARAVNVLLVDTMWAIEKNVSVVDFSGLYVDKLHYYYKLRIL